MNKGLGSRGVLVLAVSNIILKLLSALYLPILSGILSDDGIAIYNVGYDVFIFLFAITSLAFLPVITKLIAEERAKESASGILHVIKVSMNILVLFGGLAAVFLVAFSGPLSLYSKSPDSKMVFIFLAPAVFFASIVTVYRGILQGCMDMVILSTSNIIEQILNVVISIGFAAVLVRYSLALGSAGGTIGTSVGAFAAFIYLKMKIDKKYISGFKSENNKGLTRAEENEILKRLFKTVIPFIFIAALQNIIGLVDVFTVRNLLRTDINIGTATLKYYSTIINVPLVIISSISIGIYPKIIKAYIEGNISEVKSQLSYSYKLSYIVTIPSAAGLMILSGDIFKLLFNRNFGSEILVFGSVTLIFMALVTIQNTVLQGVNKFDFIIKLGFTALLVKIIINILLIGNDRINVLGAVIGTFTYYFITAVFNHISLKRYFKTNISIVNHGLKPFISSLIMAIVLFVLRYYIAADFLMRNYRRPVIILSTLILILIGAVIYSVSLIMMGGITKYELDTISSRIYNKLPNFLKKRIVS